MFEDVLFWLVVVTPLLVGALAAWHALLFKRESRAALGWIAVSLFFPMIGPLLYCLFGINRVETRARQYRGSRNKNRFIGFERGGGVQPVVLPENEQASELAGLKRAVLAVTGEPLLAGNSVAVLHNGEAAYPAMLQAIAKARHSIFLATYIFETNETGRQFIEALQNAVARGVVVRVIVDGMGEKYAWPRAVPQLRRAGIKACRFNAPRLSPATWSVNLRNHRKILVIDEDMGFTGGMNIGDRHLVADPVVINPVVDVHFLLRGSVVERLRRIFAIDWERTTGKALPELPRFEAPAAEQDRDYEVKAGLASCRVIADGPDENLDRLSLAIRAAVVSAKTQVYIMTPYFLPSEALVGCLQAAALRGVDVTIVLPAKNNLPMVHWATRNMLWELLYYGVKVLYQPPPFAHSKLVLVDDSYALVGSANIDPRSLRLNYELGLEIYDAGVVEKLGQHFRDVAAVSKQVTLDEVDERSLGQRTRDALCWLFSPYL